MPANLFDKNYTKWYHLNVYLSVCSLLGLFLIVVFCVLIKATIDKITAEFEVTLKIGSFPDAFCIVSRKA